MGAWILILYFNTYYGYVNIESVHATFTSHAACDAAAEQIKAGNRNLYGFRWTCIEAKP